MSRQLTNHSTKCLAESHLETLGKNHSSTSRVGSILSMSVTLEFMSRAFLLKGLSVPLGDAWKIFNICRNLKHACSKTGVTTPLTDELRFFFTSEVVVV